MKKWIALLVVLLCLLAGSALAEEKVKICGNEYPVTTTPIYFCANDGHEPVTTDANESNYNLKLVLDNNVPTITLRNANIETNNIVVDFDSSTSNSNLVIRGEGANRLIGTQGERPVIYVDNANCTIEGKIDLLQSKGMALYAANGDIIINGTIESCKSDDEPCFFCL